MNALHRDKNSTTASRKNGFALRSPRDRGARWTILGIALFFAIPLALACIDGFLRARFGGGVVDTISVCGCAIALLSFAGMIVYGSNVGERDRTAFVDATLEAPEEKDLLTYMWVFFHGSAKEKAQTAPIVAALLERLPDDALAAIPELQWKRLCPAPEVTVSGYAEKEDVAQRDLVHAAAFAAITRIKRLESLPQIESWVQHRNLNRHSGDFIRALHACYEALQSHEASLSHSSTLLRPASAEAAAPDQLLRPVSGTHSNAAESGAQLLRVPSVSDTNGAEERRIETNSHF